MKNEQLKDQKQNSFQSLAQRYNDNAEMVINNNNQIKHHTEELEKIVTLKTEVPAWVVAKVNRSASDLSDATHYLEGRGKYAQGGGISKYRLVPYKEKMKGYIESVSEKQVVVESTYEGASEKANELLYSDKDFVTVDVVKIGKSVLSSKKIGSVNSQGFTKYAQGGGISMEKELLSTVIQVHAQIKILHWQTESYAQHKAFNKAYKKLGDLFDNLIEVYSGKYNRPNFGGIKNIAFSDYYNVRVETFLDTTIDFFTNLFIAEQDSELANIRDEIKAELEQLKYLLTLK